MKRTVSKIFLHERLRLIFLHKVMTLWIMKFLRYWVQLKERFVGSSYAYATTHLRIQIFLTPKVMALEKVKILRIQIFLKKSKPSKKFSPKLMALEKVKILRIQIFEKVSSFAYPNFSDTKSYGPRKSQNFELLKVFDISRELLSQIWDFGFNRNYRLSEALLHMRPRLIFFFTQNCDSRKVKFLISWPFLDFSR